MRVPNISRMFAVAALALLMSVGIVGAPAQRPPAVDALLAERFALDDDERLHSVWSPAARVDFAKRVWGDTVVGLSAGSDLRLNREVI
jgi:hypothetical protein